MMASQVGHKAIYLSGGGVANASFGLPDLGMTSLNDVLTDATRITNAVDTPLLVDIDTGWGGAFNIAQTIKQIKAGVAAVHPYRRPKWRKTLWSSPQQRNRLNQRDG